MSGHSHWAGIKHRKGVNDAKRANIFTRMGRNLILAAREGGGNPDINFRLKIAIDQARSVNMPKDNIERAIKRGTGELKDGAEIEEIIYEGYGPGNVAMLIKTATDNRNRTVSEVKTILTKTGGKMVPSGSVGFLFKHVGEIVISTETVDKDSLELDAIEAGADDIIFDDTEKQCVIQTAIEDLQKTKEQLESKGYTIENAELSYTPTQTASISEEQKNQYQNLLEKLEDHDDVQDIYGNLQ